MARQIVKVIVVTARQHWIAVNEECYYYLSLQRYAALFWDNELLRP